MRCTLSFLLGLLCCHLLAQDSTVQIPVVEIIELIPAASEIPTELNNNDTQAWSTLADMQQYDGFAFINRSSLRGLASPNFRGLGFNRTQLLWNGLPLNSPANGGLDYLLIDEVAGNSWKFYSGGYSAAAGSGAIGGVLVTSERWNRVRKNEVSIAASTIQDLYLKAKLKVAHKNYIGLFKYSGTWGADSYNYQQNGVARERNDAASTIHHFIQQNNFQFKKQTLNIHFWLNSSERKLPPTESSFYRNEQQVDHNFRVAINHQYNGAQAVVLTNLGYLRENITFTNDLIPAVPTIVHRLHYDSGISKTIAKALHLKAGLGFERDWTSSYINSLQSFNTLYAFVNLRKSKKNHSYHFSLRQSARLEGDAPLTGFLKYSNQLKKGSLHLKLSKDFRQPTLNDLYWSGAMEAGNPALTSESAYGFEIKSTWQLIKQEKLSLDFRPTLFANYVEDWIQWTFDGIWSPKNLKQVSSYGVSAGINLEQKLGSGKFRLVPGYTYNPVQEWKNGATSEQLPQTPLHAGQVNLAFQFKKFTASYTHVFVGMRNISSDASLAADGFNKADLNLEYRTTQGFSFQISGINIWNQYVAHLPGNPLPGIVFQSRIRYSF